MFSKSIQYAIWCLVYTQMQNYKGHRPGTLEISNQVNVPQMTVAKIFQHLVRRGFLQSVKGKGGGFYFDTTKSEITVKELIDEFGETKVLNSCFIGFTNCISEHHCPVYEKCRPIKYSMHNLIATSTIQMLAKESMNSKKKMAKDMDD